MRSFIPLVFFISIACFVGGFIVGKKQTGPLIPVSTSASSEATIEPEDTPEPVQVAPEATAPEEISTIAEPTDSAPAVEARDIDGLAMRAKQSIVSLTDTKGRSLKAEVIEVTDSHLKVRRQSDFRIVQVPVDMLSAADQDFANYLWEQKSSAPSLDSEAYNAEQQKMLEDIFGSF